MVTQQLQNQILIVDDESDIALILKLHLEDAGYDTTWASDGESGLSLLKTNKYSLVLLDVRMPGISGVEVLQRIQQEKLDTAVIMMTAHGSENLVVECMKAGASDYVAKPFDIDDLLDRMERAIANRRILLDKIRLEKEKEEFFMMLSHDLKNPITAVIGSIDIMREGRLGVVNPEQRDYLQSAIESCQEVVAMIDNFLDIHRFELGKVKIKITPTNLRTLAEKTVKHFAPAAERENIVLTLEIAGQLPEIAADEVMLERVLANILTNAIKFTPEDGSISLSCRCIDHNDVDPKHLPPEGSGQHSFIRISVKDSGYGIPAEDLDCIFESYVQSRASGVRERGGAGLGLAFCKLAIESFNGYIWAESEEGKGSEFIMLLPCLSGDELCSASASGEQL